MFALPQMTQWAITCSIPFQNIAHKTTALLKHKQKQYSSNEMVSQLCSIPQSYADCGLMHLIASPNNSLQNSAKISSHLTS